MIWTIKLFAYSALIIYAIYRDKNCYTLNQEYEICRYKNETIITNKNVEAEYSLIFLHGLNGSPKSFETFFIQNDILPKNFRVVLPKAPTVYVTVMNQYTNSWFDILSWDFHTNNINF